MRTAQPSAIIEVRTEMADALDRALQHCPACTDEQLYDLEVQASVRDALRHASGSAFDDLLGQIRASLARPPFFVWVRGLDCNETGVLLVALSSGLGEIAEPHREHWSKVVRPIRPSSDKKVDNRPLNELLHSDGTDWVRPNDLTCLLCIRPDQHGDGRSRVVDVGSIIEDLISGGREDLLETLGSSMPWRLSNGFAEKLFFAPVISRDPLGIRWMRYTIELAAQEGLATIDSARAQALRQFEQVVETSESVTEMALQRGDLLIVDNLRCLHARTSVRWPAESERLLFRTKVHLHSA